MKAPLEHLESSTPMSAGEGSVYVLIGGALIGIGYAIGLAKASIMEARRIKEETRNGPANYRTRSSDRNRGSNKPQTPNN